MPEKPLRAPLSTPAPWPALLQPRCSGQLSHLRVRDPALLRLCSPVRVVPVEVHGACFVNGFCLTWTMRMEKLCLEDQFRRLRDIYATGRRERNRYHLTFKCFLYIFARNARLLSGSAKLRCWSLKIGVCGCHLTDRAETGSHLWSSLSHTLSPQSGSSLRGWAWTPPAGTPPADWGFVGQLRRVPANLPICLCVRSQACIRSAFMCKV